jgi:hypothetical protein
VRSSASVVIQWQTSNLTKLTQTSEPLKMEKEDIGALAMEEDDDYDEFLAAIIQEEINNVEEEEEEAPKWRGSSRPGRGPNRKSMSWTKV